ncbi:MAG: nucleotidyltransferase domain-containing protein [Thermodesulfobacteriota bacterium]|nr:nucleotidyltransferase domain-containing protein [Thermodesulfobacteriota bacterium]
MNQQTDLIMKELKEGLHNKFNFVSDVILFGSQDTGKAFEFSDYDILVIVSHPISWRQRREISDEIYSIDLKYNILTDVNIISEPELKTLRGKQPFIQRAIQEGIVA